MSTAQEIVIQLNQYREELQGLRSLVNSDFKSGFEKIDRIKNRLQAYIDKMISPEEGEKCKKIRHQIMMGDPEGNFIRTLQSIDIYIETLVGEIENHPDDYLNVEEEQGQEIDTDLNSLDIIKNLCSRFHIVAKQLRSRREGRNSLDVSDEYDVQDLLHALLKIFFDDVRPEEWTPSYAGSSSRIDFILKDEKIALEVKMTRDNLKDKQVGEQLIIDIERYNKHPDCSKLICFVYDPMGLIGNPRGIESDLNQRSDDNLEVIVWIYPR